METVPGRFGLRDLIVLHCLVIFPLASVLSGAFPSFAVELLTNQKVSWCLHGALVTILSFLWYWMFWQRAPIGLGLALLGGFVALMSVVFVMSNITGSNLAVKWWRDSSQPPDFVFMHYAPPVIVSCVIALIMVIWKIVQCHQSSR